MKINISGKHYPVVITAPSKVDIIWVADYWWYNGNQQPYIGIARFDGELVVFTWSLGYTLLNVHRINFREKVTLRFHQLLYEYCIGTGDSPFPLVKSRLFHKKRNPDSFLSSFYRTFIGFAEITIK